MGHIRLHGFFLLNLLPAYLLDGGQMLRPAGRSIRSRANTPSASRRPRGLMAAVALLVWGVAHANFILVGVALLIYMACEQERMQVQSGAGDEGSPYGFDVKSYYRRDEEPAAVVRRRKWAVFERIVN